MDKLTEQYKLLVRNSWRLFTLSHQSWGKLFDQYGLSSATFPVVELSVQNPGITQQEISNALSIDKGNISRSIRYLVGNGLLLREKSKECSHGFCCYPTDKARDVYHSILEVQSAYIHDLFGEINVEKMESDNAFLLRLIEKIGSQADKTSK